MLYTGALYLDLAKAALLHRFHYDLLRNQQCFILAHPLAVNMITTTQTMGAGQVHTQYTIHICPQNKYTYSFFINVSESNLHRTLQRKRLL